MSNLKEQMIDDLLVVEGGYVDDPSDSGGETNWGVTVKVARSYGYAGKMIDMPESLAREIYEDRYWNSIGGDRLARQSEAICEEVFDTCVNMGCDRATRFLQRSLNVLNNRQEYYNDIKVDGDIGPATEAALVLLLNKRGEEGETVLNRMLNSLQGAAYVELAERREKDERFIYGWYKNRVVM